MSQINTCQIQYYHVISCQTCHAMSYHIMSNMPCHVISLPYLLSSIIFCVDCLFHSPSPCHIMSNIPGSHYLSHWYGSKSVQYMLNTVLSYHIISCHVMTCHIMSCHVMSNTVLTCHIMLSMQRVNYLFHYISLTLGPIHIKHSIVMSHHMMSCHVMIYKTQYCHVMSCNGNKRDIEGVL